MVLVWYRKREDLTLLAAGFGVSRATAYRYRDEVTTVLSATAPDLHDALRRVAEEGWSHVILDGKVFTTDRCAGTTTSVKGNTIDAWYSGKHRSFGGNVQAVMRPDGLPIWTSPVSPGHRHDMTVAHEHDALAALYWAASQLDLPTLADSGYEGAGQGVYTPFKQPSDGRPLQSLNGQVVSGSRVRPVWVRKLSRRSVRYWMLLSRFLMIAWRWSIPLTARLPMLRFRCDQTASVGLRSGA
ncbi:IS5/IS1182 family transposase [Dactylosporangium sp. NBC_01737]|uniref:transposase family protein n=1 Tax=Dactylosporangium sp. NBC_01737 TaxID=2975959 RepID=UPI002E10FF1A|nr:IS5/IS1182 family transposase [Dactylosporangium sp. NBC_01737]